MQIWGISRRSIQIRDCYISEFQELWRLDPTADLLSVTGPDRSRPHCCSISWLWAIRLWIIRLSVQQSSDAHVSDSTDNSPELNPQHDRRCVANNAHDGQQEQARQVRGHTIAVRRKREQRIAKGITCLGPQLEARHKKGRTLNPCCPGGDHAEQCDQKGGVNVLNSWCV